MKTDKNTGFTVMETMTFLLVSSVIFISVAALISGQIGRYQSKDAVNQLESVVRSTLNDVGNGYYPIIGNGFKCSLGVGKKPPTVTLLDTTEENRGTNSECIIIGKSIQFNENNMQIKTWVANYDIEEKPTSISEITEVGDLAQTVGYKWGVKPRASDIGKEYFVLYSKFGTSKQPGTDSFLSGAQDIQVSFKINNSIDNAVTTPNNKVCFENGNKWSSLNFGDNSLSVSTQYEDEGC